MMVPGTVTQHKAAVAIGAFHKIFVAHFQIDPWMAKASSDAVAGNTAGIDFNDFGHFDRHGTLYLGENGRIIVLKICLASG